MNTNALKYIWQNNGHDLIILLLYVDLGDHVDLSAPITEATLGKKCGITK